MKVLYDHQIFTAQKFGGISRYFSEIMKISDQAFQLDRIDPSLFPEPYTAPSQPNLVSRGVSYLKRRAGITGENKKESLPREVIDTLKKGDYDIFHPTYYDTYFLEYVDKPFVLTVYDMIHEIYPEMFGLSDGTSSRKRLLCNKATSILAISHNTKADLVKLFNIDPEKIHAIPLASDFDEVRTKTPENSGDLNNFILFTGSRWSYKNFYFTALALADILKQDRTLQLLCTGHPFSPPELEFFKELGIENQVKHLFLKGDQELAWAYRHARLFVFPSLYEGFGFPLLEAFASDCPVITSKGGSLSEVGGEGALFFDPKDVTQIQDAATAILYNTDTKNKMIEKGRAQFAKYSWVTCRAQTLEVYRKMLNDHQ